MDPCIAYPLFSALLNLLVLNAIFKCNVALMQERFDNMTL